MSCMCSSGSHPRLSGAIAVAPALHAHCLSFQSRSPSSDKTNLLSLAVDTIEARFHPGLRGAPLAHPLHAAKTIDTIVAQ